MWATNVNFLSISYFDLFKKSQIVLKLSDLNIIIFFDLIILDVSTVQFILCFTCLRYFLYWMINFRYFFRVITSTFISNML